MLEGKKEVTASKTKLEFFLLFQRVAFPPAWRILYYVAVRCKMETFVRNFHTYNYFYRKVLRLTKCHVDVSRRVTACQEVSYLVPHSYSYVRLPLT